jgi:hypothetical protein
MGLQAAENFAGPWSGLARMGWDGSCKNGFVGDGLVGIGSVGIGSVGNGSVAKKVAADPPSFNWFGQKLKLNFLSIVDGIFLQKVIRLFFSGPKNNF